MSTLKQIETWFQAHCDGDWEHGAGIRISSLDNPGWAIEIDIVGTELEEKTLSRTKVDRTERDWLWSWTEDGKFKASCGASNLEEALLMFLQWSRS